MNKSILVISDTHIPYHHKDLIPYLIAIKKEYKPDEELQLETRIKRILYKLI